MVKRLLNGSRLRQGAEGGYGTEEFRRWVGGGVALWQVSAEDDAVGFHVEDDRIPSLLLG